MFDHVTIRASDRPASERFYDLVLGVLGVERTGTDETFVEWSDFSVAVPDDENPVTRGLHVGFVTASREAVDAFWRTGAEAGYASDGEPGPRPEYGEDYYGGFLLDPDGNSAEAVHHGGLRRGGVVDHVWIRVADVAASKRFYELVAPHAGFRLAADTPERAQFAGESGSFSVVAGGTPTEAVHMAFTVASHEPIHAFHEDALAAGYRDNGAPGERPDYGPGYYAAFVRDPDGNNIELVTR
jgi:catechol 2,3-dioxygenase-like lactoylglutathione lyase family enzyme